MTIPKNQHGHPVGREPELAWPYQEPPDRSPVSLPPCLDCGEEDNHLTAEYVDGTVYVRVSCPSCGTHRKIMPATPVAVRYAMTKPGQGGMRKGQHVVDACLELDPVPTPVLESCAVCGATMEKGPQFIEGERWICSPRCRDSLHKSFRSQLTKKRA